MSTIVRAKTQDLKNVATMARLGDRGETPDVPE
jgi:hypothetical protein